MGGRERRADVRRGAARTWKADLDRFVNGVVRRRRIPGLALGFLRDRRVVLARGYGERDVSGGRPATPDTVFGIASMTKSFTALAVLRLQELHRLRVSDPVVRHLPQFRTPDPRWTRRITLHHFLTHSSGLPPLPSIYYTSGRSLERDPPYDPKVARRVGIDPDHPPIDTYEQLLDYLGTTRYRLLGPPGRYFSYSNEGFGLLGAVVERASGRTYESFLEEEVLRPAGMLHSTFDTGIMRRGPEVTKLYSPNWTRPHRPKVESEEWWEDTCLRAAGALRTNVRDLLRYLEIFLHDGRVEGRQVVSPSSVRAMTRPYVPVGPGTFYGYGLFVRPDHHGFLLAYHPGGLKGVSSEFAVVPSAGVGGVVLANSDDAPSALPLEAGMNALLGLPRAAPFADVPHRARPSVPLVEYAGWYCSGEGIWCRVRARRDHLQADFVGIEITARGLRLWPAGPDAFFRRAGGRTTWVHFARDARGRIWSVHLGVRLVRRRDPTQLPAARTGKLVW